MVSVIIPTYRDWQRLEKCLQALQLQSLPKDQFEVIVVNNDPSDKVPVHLKASGDVTFIDEPKPGSYAARNTAIRKAKGEIIAFTDSDCVPHCDWLKNAVDYFAVHKDTRRIAGEIAILQASDRITAIEAFNKVYAFPQKWYVENVGTSVTANLITYKELFSTVGMFNENLYSQGDSVWAKKASELGLKLDFVPDVIVYHPIRNWSELVKKERRLGGADATMKKNNQFALRPILEFIFSLRPRYKEVFFVKRFGRELDLTKKIQILVIRHLLLYLRSFEKLKVHFGKQASRS
jgi:glycosyltransferase involved in cell wall biosynthesis